VRLRKRHTKSFSFCKGQDSSNPAVKSEAETVIMSNIERNSIELSADEKSANASPVSTRSTHPNADVFGVSKEEDYGEKVTNANFEDNKSSSQTSLPHEGPRDEETGAPIKKVTTKHSVSNVASIPNGGTLAWLQVLGAFFLFFNTWYVCFHSSVIACRRFSGSTPRSPGYAKSIYRLFQISYSFNPGLWFAAGVQTGFAAGMDG
jgi:hypothetical protein